MDDVSKWMKSHESWGRGQRAPSLHFRPAMDEVTTKIPTDEIRSIIRFRQAPARGSEPGPSRDAARDEAEMEASEQRSVLVTGAATRATAAVVAGLQQAECKVYLGLHHAQAAFGGPAASEACRLVPTPQEDHYVETIHELAKSLGVDAIVPTAEDELLLMAEAKECFEESGIEVLVPDAQVVELCRDRVGLMAALEPVVPVPMVADDGMVSEADAGRWIIRSNHGLRRSTSRIATRAELKGDRRPGEVLFEYLPGEELWVDILRGRGGLGIVGSVSRVERYGRTRLVSGAEDVFLLERLAKEAAAAVGLAGHATIRFRRDCIGLPMAVDIMPGFSSAALDEDGRAVPLVARALGLEVDSPPTQE